MGVVSMLPITSLRHRPMEQTMYTNQNLFCRVLVMSQPYNVSMINFVYLLTPFGDVKI